MALTEFISRSDLTAEGLRLAEDAERSKKIGRAHV